MRVGENVEEKERLCTVGGCTDVATVEHSVEVPTHKE